MVMAIVEYMKLMQPNIRIKLECEINKANRNWSNVNKPNVVSNKTWDHR